MISILRNNTIEKILGVLAIFSLFIIFAMNVQDAIKETNAMFKKYPLLKKEDHLNAVVKSFDLYRSATLVDFQDGTHSCIRAWTSKNRDFISNYLGAGDSLVYISGRDFIVIYKKDSDDVLSIPVHFVE